jgi:pilus assembly protein CpaB
MSRNLALVISVLLGLLAVGLIYIYLQKVKTNVYEGMDMVTVLVADVDINKGDQLTSQNVAFRPYPQKYVAGRSIGPEQANSVLGAVVNFNIEKGKPIFWSDLVKQNLLDEGLASEIQPGMKAMTIPVTQITGLSGMLRAGMHIDILLTVDASCLGMDNPPPAPVVAPTATGNDNQAMSVEAMKAAMAANAQQASKHQEKATVLLLQNILILAAGSNRKDNDAAASSDNPGRDQSYTTLTLMLKPEEARILTLASAQGQINILLRKAGDTTLNTGSPVTTCDSVKDYLQSLGQPNNMP